MLRLLLNKEYKLNLQLNIFHMLHSLIDVNLYMISIMTISSNKMMKTIFWEKSETRNISDERAFQHAGI